MVSTEERLATLEAGLIEVRSDQSEQRRHNEAVERKIDQLHDLLAARPSWAVTAYITAVSSAAVGMAVALATMAP